MDCKVGNISVPFLYDQLLGSIFNMSNRTPCCCNLHGRHMRVVSFDASISAVSPISKDPKRGQNCYFLLQMPMGSRILLLDRKLQGFLNNGKEIVCL